MKKAILVFLVTLMSAVSFDAGATVECPDIQKDKTQYLIIARGKVEYAMEPEPVLSCPKRNFFAQCPMPLGTMPNPRNRLMFKVDEYYYINPQYLINTPYKAGTKANKIGGVSHDVVISGVQTYVGSEALLATFQTNQYGDFDTAGCQQILLKSNPAFEEAIKRAEKLTQ